MKKTLLSLAIITLLGGCATGSAIREKITNEQFDEPKIEQSVYLNHPNNKVNPPNGGPIAVAVYNFQDKTGQRKSLPGIASLSSAVTQGAETYLIKALQDVGEGRWFTVIERVGLDNLIKERQMIRQMREQYQGRDAKPLPPMLFAGVIVEGAIVGYDSNTQTGGAGVRIFGIGTSTQYQSDTVTVSLRTVSVTSGEILTTVTVTKTVLSYMDKLTLIRFVNDGTNALESELGGSINESINKATSIAIQAAVVDTIREGARKGHWGFVEPKKEVPVEKVEPATPLPVALPAPVVEPKKEVPVEKVEPVVAPPVATEVKPVAEVPAKPQEKSAPKADKNINPTAIINDWVNLRVGQTTNSEKIRQLAPGESVEILKTDGNFLFVRVNKKEGWVDKKHVRLQK